MATCITNTERAPDRLDIAFLGYNARLTKYGLRQFVENNIEQVGEYSPVKNSVMLKDGTRIIGLFSVDDGIRGYRFDQLILFDDERWNIKWHRAEDIRLIQALTMQQSNVPEEFQILKYEDIR